MPLPSDPKTIFLGGLFILVALTALQAASAIILPVILAFILKLLLQPFVRLLERLRVPQAAGALLIIMLVVGGLVGLGTALSGPAETWAARLPAGIPRLGEHLRFLRTPFEVLQRTLHQAEQVATGPAPSNRTDALQGGFTDTIIGDVRALVGGLFTTMLVLFFLLVSGDTFLRRVVEILPRFRDKRQAVDISQQIEHDISGYLLTITTMNAAVGSATAVAMHVSGLGDPVLWGAVAFLLNYVPILGPLTGMGIFFLAGLLTFDSLWHAMLPVGLYVVIHLIEGEIVTPMLVARRFTLNPVVVILSLIFWFWMWGVPGAILSVPMLAIAKIVCDRIRPLMALGHFLEG
ncbi:MAG TPA: AI-2E family transporter [Alphaproteobacteria bacterium]|nr:AI-2E family transporter [Alphaproteobacteria bacterium]